MFRLHLIHCYIHRGSGEIFFINIWSLTSYPLQKNIIVVGRSFFLINSNGLLLKSDKILQNLDFWRRLHNATFCSLNNVVHISVPQFPYFCWKGYSRPTYLFVLHRCNIRSSRRGEITRGSIFNGDRVISLNRI